MMPLEDKQLSVVLQGPCHFGKKDSQISHQAVASIRKHFPNAELIFSTWKNSDIPKGLDVDVVVFNNDPGGQSLSLAVQQKTGKPFGNNINRQLVSSLGGVQVASRPYVLKARTDMVFYSNKCLDWWNLATHRNPAHSAFKERMLGYAFGTRKARNPSGVLNLQYHPGDWFYLGLKEDMVDLFDIPLCPESCVNYLLDNKILPSSTQWWVTHQWYPEIYLWVSYLKKKGIPVTMAHSFDNRVENDLPSIQSLVNNFLLLDADQIGFVNGKYLFPVMEANELGLASMMCYQDWLDAYLELCVPENQKRSNEVKTLIQRSLPQQQWEQAVSVNNLQSEACHIEGIIAPTARVSVTA